MCRYTIPLVSRSSTGGQDYGSNHLQCHFIEVSIVRVEGIHQLYPRLRFIKSNQQGFGKFSNWQQANTIH